MTLQEALRPIFTFNGLQSLLILTRDGLPVEMIGYGLRAEHLAAEIAGAAEASRRCYERLGMGVPRHQQVQLSDFEVVTFTLEHHYLALVLDGGGTEDLIPYVSEHLLTPLRRVLGGEA